MNDLVSVIIPNFNGAQFIERCIQSVQDQSYTNREVIIIDDGSTDGSKEIIDAFTASTEKIKAIFLNENYGTAVARNRGIELAQGRFIAFLDNDDAWLPAKLEVQIAYMKQNSCALSYSSYYSLNENFQDQKLIEAKPSLTYQQLLTSNYIGCLTAIYDTTILGKRYFPALKKRQDWALWLQIIKEGYTACGIQ